MVVTGNRFYDSAGLVTRGGAGPAILGIRPPDATGRIWIDLRASPGSSWVLEVTSDLLSWSDLATVELDVEVF